MEAVINIFAAAERFQNDPDVLCAHPQDIISLILEQHLFNDTSALKACSLVSRSFVAPSQKGLFHTIHLRAQQHCRKLHRVFLDNHELLTYVRELYVMEYGSGALSYHGGECISLGIYIGLPKRSCST